MELEAYLVQVETQDQQPEPISVHSSFAGALQAAEERGAETRHSKPDETVDDWYFNECGDRRYVVIAIHKLRLLP